MEITNSTIAADIADQQANLYNKAKNEKIVSAENSAAKARLMVLSVNLVSYFFINHSKCIPWLAYTMIVLAPLYGLYIYLFKPYKRYSVLRTSYFTYSADALLISLWLIATGGFYSNYFILWQLSVVAVAYRYNFKTTLLSALLYSLCYIALLLLMRQLVAHITDVLVRCAYIFITAYVVSLITRETFTQTFEKNLMRDVNAKLQAAEQELITKTDALAGLNNELEEKIGERTREIEAYAQRFKLLLDSIPLIAWTTDKDGKSDYRNKEFHRFAGTNDLEGLEAKDYIHPDDIKPMMDKWAQSKQSGDPMMLEYRWKRYDGIYRWMLGRAVSLKDDKQNILLWIGTATDINDQKELLELKDQFIGVASHELKTPLTSIKAYAQLVEQSLKTEEYEAAKIFTAKTEMYITRLERLINDLLDVSKMQSDKMAFHLAEFDMNKLAKETADNARDTNKTHKITFVPANHKAIIYADRQRMEQALNNLISNAIKYSPGKNSIEVRVTIIKNNVQVQVTDNGIGIPAEKITSIFDRFYRVNEGATAISGLGLGLFITREIISHHNGNLWVHSQPGKGSTFYFSIPLSTVKRDHIAQ